MFVRVKVPIPKILNIPPPLKRAELADIQLEFRDDGIGQLGRFRALLGTGLQSYARDIASGQRDYKEGEDHYGPHDFQ